MEKKKVKISFVILAALLFLIFTLFLIRAFSYSEVDDVSPEINCEKEITENNEILWVIPNFNNEPISENKEWCKYILELNKTIGMHGVSHTFQEFKTNRDQDYLEYGIQIFEDCLGYKPQLFKPPQLKISKENKKLIENNNLTLKIELNQWTHKVYHCGEYGKKKNWIIDLF